MSTLPQPRRENDLPRVVTFDDQVWPVNVAIAILASFAAGAMIARGRFDDPRPLTNGWTHLSLLVLFALLLMWCVSKINRRRIRRGLQLATLVSLILHLLFIVVLHNDRLNLLAARRPRIPRPYAPPEVYVVPDYAFRTPRRGFRPNRSGSNHFPRPGVFNANSAPTPIARSVVDGSNVARKRTGVRPVGCFRIAGDSGHAWRPRLCLGPTRRRWPAVEQAGASRHPA